MITAAQIYVGNLLHTSLVLPIFVIHFTTLMLLPDVKRLLVGCNVP